MDDSQARYDKLFQFAVGALRSIRTPQERLAVVAQFLARGVKADYTRGELIDVFCVSTPNVVEEAGVRGAEAEAIVRAFDEECARSFRA